MDHAPIISHVEVVEMLYRYVDGDKTLLQKISVNNSARPHGLRP